MMAEECAESSLEGCVANSRMRMNLYLFSGVRLGCKTEGDTDEPDLLVNIALF